MKIISIEGFVVSTINYKESSSIINIITKEYGVIGLISKGCKRPKSPLSKVSINLTYAVFHMYYKPSGLSTLIGGDVINTFPNIKKDIVKVTYLNYILELAKNVILQNNIEDIYNILLASILKIEEGYNPLAISNMLEVKYTSFLGVEIQTDKCILCSKDNPVLYSPSNGGFVCEKCITNEERHDTQTLKLINMYKYVDISKISTFNIDDKILKEVDKIITSYYEDYTGVYLKSRGFLKNIKTIET
ncbi:MAG: DNA repair protein RecO [Bacilli bacterium]